MSSSNPASNNSKDEYLFPQSKYYGQFTPEQLAFNANLQEFSQRISIICSLETGGKLSPLDAYEQIKQAWKELKQSKKGLSIGQQPPQPEDAS